MIPKIVIVDYNMGNLRSVLKKFETLKMDAIISSDLKVIENASKLILPGVGHFGAGIARLKSSGIWEVLNQKVLIEKTPVLGICLGMQLMAKFSEEGNVEGFGWFDAQVVRFKVSDKLKFKVPQIGWNTLDHLKQSKVMEGIPNEAMFYFIHSYHLECNDRNDMLCTTNYDYDFVSVIQKEHIFGTQFHPEKSHDSGEKLIKNFIEKV